MSTDMIKEMSGVKDFHYDLNGVPKSALIKKAPAKSNPDRLAYESNVKQPAGKIFQGHSYADLTDLSLNPFL